jgi:hypothetical protein
MPRPRLKPTEEQRRMVKAMAAMGPKPNSGAGDRAVANLSSEGHMPPTFSAVRLLESRLDLRPGLLLRSQKR